MTQTRALPWYFAPAVVIVAGCLVAIVNFGVRSSFGLFTGPVSEAHGWPREIFSFAMALQNLLWGIGTPIAGALADRYGSAKVLMTGAAVYFIGVLMMAWTDQAMFFNIGGGILVGICIAMSSFSIVMAALGRIVPPEKRSWAFGIATASGSMGQFIFSPLAAALIGAYGWQSALVILASCSLLIIPFALPLLMQKPQSGVAHAGEADISMGEAVKRAFGHGSYWLLVSGFFVCGFQIAFVTVHLPPYLAEHGISKEFAGLAMGAIGLFNVIGAYSAGIIGGRGEKRVPLSMIYLARSVTIAVFIMLPISNLTTILFTASLGLLWLSTVPFTMGLVVVMFGTRYMATLYGFVFVSHQLGSFLGVWLGGRLYDQFGSYDPVWWMGVALGIFAAIVNLPIRERRAARIRGGVMRIHRLAFLFFAGVFVIWLIVMAALIRASALPPEASGVMLAVFEPGTSPDMIFASLTRAEARPIRETAVGFIWVVAGDQPGLAGRLAREGTIGTYRDLPISPTIAGCFALADAKAAVVFGI